MIYDTLFRFDTQSRADEVFPVDLVEATVQDTEGNPVQVSYRPSSWTLDTGQAVLPVTVTEVLPNTVTPGFWYAVSGDFDPAFLQVPEFVASRNRETGQVEHSIVQSPIDIPVQISPIWAGMNSEFVLPATAS